MIKESGINITKAAFPAPFESGLEYNPPTRGVWNIVHTGMLIPESRQIFVCAQGCLRVQRSKAPSENPAGGLL